MKNHLYTTIISSLSNCKTFKEVKQIHALIITTSLSKQIIPISKLIDFCTDSSPPYLHYAETIFLQIPNPSLYIYNSILKGHSKSHNPIAALLLYTKMQHLGYSPDHHTFPFILKACANDIDVKFGKCVHDQIVKTGFEVDVYASTSLIHMYMCCGGVGDAEKVFDEMPKRNVVGWTSLISGYVGNGRAKDAIRVFKEMELEGVEGNEISMVNVLVACGQCRDLEMGRWVHERIRQMGFDSSENIVVGNTLLDMYAKCGCLDVARGLFDGMARRNVVVWNSMIGAYNQCGQASEALKLFVSMRLSGVKPDEATMLGLLGACANLEALGLGQGLHAYIEKTDIVAHVSIGTSLMVMYAKSGDRHSAFQIFSCLPKKDVKAWTSMIMGLAKHGHGKEAVDLFSEMQKAGNVNPDEITYIGVLTACSHAGLVDEGYKHFDSMRNVYGIVPTEEHYGCMVDLLSRAGKLNEAENLIRTMPVEPNVAIWGALLNGCDIHDNIDLAEKVESHIMELNSPGTGVHVLLANIYAKAGKWQGVKRIRDLMRHRGYAKTHGCSVVETKLLNVMEASQG
ncbi:hypothetical protein ACHQM5_019348 [Ranunculus cassubicifolius]